MLNNSINASDPSGHRCVGEPEECQSENGRPINGAGGFALKITKQQASLEDLLKKYRDSDTTWDELSEEEQEILEGYQCGASCLAEDQSGGGEDVSWTLEDWPTISITVAVSCVATGLCATIGAAGFYTCLRIASCASILAQTTGITVYRVWGGSSGPGGNSWTPIDPRTVIGYAGTAGLPPGNTAQGFTVGIIYSMENVTITTASRILSNPGGLLEYYMTNPQVQVFVQEVQYWIK